MKDGAFTDTLPGRTTRLYASRPLNARLPEIAVARARLAAEQQKEDQARADDLARYECGAAVESSWGFSTEAPAAAWRRMIDGRRGSSYKIGDPGFFLKRAGKTSPDAALSGAGRWVEVRLPKPCAIGSIAVVSQNAQFDIACGIGADLKLVPAQRSGSDAHNAAPVDIAEAMLVPPRTIDRVRIQFTRDPLPGKGERIFEIEARKAP